jgi:hypothetical protein
MHPDTKTPSSALSRSNSYRHSFCVPEDFVFAGANFLFSEDYCVVLSSGICPLPFGCGFIYKVSDS